MLLDGSYSLYLHNYTGDVMSGKKLNEGSSDLHGNVEDMLRDHFDEINGLLERQNSQIDNKLESQEKKFDEKFVITQDFFRDKLESHEKMDELKNDNVSEKLDKVVQKVESLDNSIRGTDDENGLKGRLIKAEGEIETTQGDVQEIKDSKKATIGNWIVIVMAIFSSGTALAIAIIK